MDVNKLQPTAWVQSRFGSSLNITDTEQTDSYMRQAMKAQRHSSLQSGCLRSTCTRALTQGAASLLA